MLSEGCCVSGSAFPEVNADLIASGLSPFSPAVVALRDGRIMIEEIKSHVHNGDSFAFESTLSGLTYARLIRQWRNLGYRVKLIYLSLPSADMAVARVKARVAQGGHDIPEQVVRRRFAASWRNFREKYRMLVDAWVHYDNSGDQPKKMEEGESL